MSNLKGKPGKIVKSSDITMASISSQDSTMESATSTKTAIERQRVNAEIQKCIDDDKDIEPKLGLRALILNLFTSKNEPRLDLLEERMDATEHSLTIVESIADDNSDNMKKQRDEIIYAQIEATRNRVIIRNLPLHPSTKPGERELPKNTIEVMSDLFVTLKLEMRHFPDVYRYSHANKPTTRNAKSPIISAIFHSSASFTAFMTSLPNLKENPKHKYIKVEKDFPSILRPNVEKANAKAFQLRTSKTNKMPFTNVKVVKTEVKLYAKKKREDPWKEMDY